MTTIVHIISSSDTGGAQTLLLNILQNIDTSKYRLIVICNHEGHYVSDFQNYANKTYLLNFNHKNPLKEFFFAYNLYSKIRKIIIKEKVDIVHNHLWKACFYGSHAAQGIVKKVFNNLHGELISEVEESSLKLNLYRYLYQKLQGRSIAISHYNAKELVKLGIKKEDITVIYNAIDAIYFNHIHHKNIIHDNPFNVLCIARIFPQKGIDYLLETAEKLDNNIQINIIGDGVDYKEISLLIKKKNLSNIHLLGFKKDVRPYLEQADVFVLPSRWEGFGIVLLEAMAYELPIIASNTGGIPEIVQHDKGGLLFDVGNINQLIEHLIFLKNNIEIRKRMGNHNKAYFLKHFTLKKMIENLDKLYTNN